ncbi:winged helix-turn-helix domain-containing protein [Sandaracinobacteroides hominis]|uniref:winged helix-turn-helix domain-containing protein n=1 Tax=Sandaracinobacteroides hominis TaxID=2780086 RepID=UPI0018F4ABB1|nr:LysR family transcriptional regulator [Sandaracinobacteroides hominis]
MVGLLKLKAQLLVDGEIALGPGKADLLEAIVEHGSISAAGRAMGLSYRRAWLMVEAMNRLFAKPLVETKRGGPGGAALTEAGRAVLAEYRGLQAELEAAALKRGAKLVKALG